MFFIRGPYISKLPTIIYCCNFLLVTPIATIPTAFLATLPAPFLAPFPAPFPAFPFLAVVIPLLGNYAFYIAAVIYFLLGLVSAVAAVGLAAGLIIGLV